MNYYSETLAAEKLKQCYDIAPLRVKQYLEAEINYVLQKIKPADIVLELGCGYGRVLSVLAAKAKRVTGIDTSSASIEYGKKLFYNLSNCHFILMDANSLSFPGETFDVVICIQNGISAFHVDRKQLIKESIRVTKKGGTVLFSTYSEKFWKHRLEWFKLQSEAGLLGEIDYSKTGSGTIVCKDGFTAYTLSIKDLRELCSGINADVKFTDVDGSSLFCEMILAS
jgi:2-polyprenyl-6-hydroxyphenyl methylase/3-demethylubiquinone-9 3-methyltransferase